MATIKNLIAARSSNAAPSPVVWTSAEEEKETNIIMFLRNRGGKETSRVMNKNITHTP